MEDHAGAYVAFANAPATSTTFTVGSYTTADVAVASKPFTLTCQKSGNDYLTASSSVYSQASANYDWTSYTPTLGAGWGTTVATNLCKHKRIGSELYVRCYGTIAGITSGLGSISLPSGLLIDSTKMVASNIVTVAGERVGAFNQTGVNFRGSIVAALGTSTSLVYISPEYDASGTSEIPLANMNAVFQNGLFTLDFRVPIATWSNPNYIVGSFADSVTMKSSVKTALVTASVSSTGVVTNDISDFISGNCAMSGGSSSTATCTFNSGFFTAYSACWVPVSAGGILPLTTTSGSTTTAIVRMQSPLGVDTATAFQLFCLGY